MNKTYISLGIVTIAIVGVFLFKSNQSNSTTTGTNNGSNPSTGMMVESNSIAVSSQGESNLLAASMVVLTEPGYLVVHEDVNGQPGAVMGTSSLLNSGMDHVASVTLSRKLVKGEKIYAMLHKDNGDKVYSAADLPVTGKSGESVMMIVTVGAENSSAPGAMSM